MRGGKRGRTTPRRRSGQRECWNEEHGGGDETAKPETGEPRCKPAAFRGVSAYQRRRGRRLANAPGDNSKGS
eukprot:ctg_253.g149